MITIRKTKDHGDGMANWKITADNGDVYRAFTATTDTETEVCFHDGDRTVYPTTDPREAINTHVDAMDETNRIKSRHFGKR